MPNTHRPSPTLPVTRLRALVAMALAALSLAPGCSSAERPPTVLLVTLDTTPPAFFSCYGSTTRTPRFDSLPPPRVPHRIRGQDKSSENSPLLKPRGRRPPDKSTENRIEKMEAESDLERWHARIDPTKAYDSDQDRRQQDEQIEKKLQALKNDISK